MFCRAVKRTSPASAGYQGEKLQGASWTRKPHTWHAPRTRPGQRFLGSLHGTLPDDQIDARATVGCADFIMVLMKSRIDRRIQLCDCEQVPSQFAKICCAPPNVDLERTVVRLRSQFGPEATMPLLSGRQDIEAEAIAQLRIGNTAAEDASRALDDSAPSNERQIDLDALDAQSERSRLGRSVDECRQ